ncbi:hypothetical protein [Patulibacter defluvii]|uniref:hypothetical protein n=1 Tax=Patulibacter defluvii TaxID=3095358 RepID=UPI002A762F06|nr:hypothetical protein [Patulibacter sp. DM4]
MDQHTYSFPKVTPVDAQELREDLRAARRQSATGDPRRAEREGERRDAPARRHDD